MVYAHSPCSCLAHLVICGCVRYLCGIKLLIATTRQNSVKSPRTWASLICSCIATRGWEGAIKEGGEQGCHVELTENCTTPQRKITQGTNGRLVRLSFSLLLLGSPFFITSSLSIVLISHKILFAHLVSFSGRSLCSLCPMMLRSQEWMRWHLYI